MNDTLLEFLAESDAIDERAEVEAAEAGIGHWYIKDLGAAEWAMARYAALTAEAQALEDQAAAWRERIDAWLASQRAPVERHMAFFQAHLINYARRRREADPAAKTLTLPSGKVTSTACNARVEIVDAEAFAAWAEANGLEHLLRYKPSPVMAVVKAELEVKSVEDGDVPGAVVKPAEVTFKVKPEAPPA